MTTYPLPIALRSPELNDALRNRANRLEARIQELGLGADGVSWPEGTAAQTAKYYARRIAAGDAEVAAEVLRVLVDETEAQDHQFWSTELGRALFLLRAFHLPEMSRLTAQAILGLRSRQRVHQLVVDGLLVETQGGTITTESVLGLLRKA